MLWILPTSKTAGEQAAIGSRGFEPGRAAVPLAVLLPGLEQPRGGHTRLGLLHPNQTNATANFGKG
jgi:hypothetical protein